MRKQEIKDRMAAINGEVDQLKEKMEAMLVHLVALQAEAEMLTQEARELPIDSHNDN
jgi:uncharacterized protein (DUF3084 family)